MLRSAWTVLGLFVAGPACAADPPKITDLIRQLEAGTDGERVIAAERLGDLGPAAAEAIPALARVAGAARGANKHLNHAAIEALTGIGPKSAPALVKLLPEEKRDLFGWSASALLSFGRDAAPVVPELAKLLDDDDQNFRATVAGVLEKIGPGAEPAIPDLITLFLSPKNKDKGIWASGPLPPPPRVAAARVLVRIGAKATPAITEKMLPVLTEEVKSGDRHEGGSAWEVLYVLGEAGAPIVPAVVATIRKDEGFDREDAGWALLGLGETGRRAFGELLVSPDVKVRRKMVKALDRFLVNERFYTYYRFDAPPLDITPFVPALVAALKDTEPERRLVAGEVLCRLRTKAPRDVVDAVASLYRDPAIKKKAEEKAGLLYPEPSLCGFGEPGARALVALLDSDSTAIRKIAVNQLRYSRKWSAVALPRLRKLADDPDPALACDAAYTATWISLDSRDAVPLVTQRWLRNPDPEVRADVAKHIGWLGPIGAPHLDALVPLLDDKDEEVVQAAARAIHDQAPKGSIAARALAARKLVSDGAGRFVPAPDMKPEPAPRGVAELIEALSDRGDAQRFWTAIDLADRGAAAKAAVPALKSVLTDPDRNLRFAAAYTLACIENDTPALRRLLATELERADRGRPISDGVSVVFARLPPDFPELIPSVVRWLERERDATLLMEGLAKYGPKAKGAVPVLRKVLHGPEHPNHHYFGSELKPTCETLGAIGPDARAALPELQEMFDSGEVGLALAARDAIQKITGGK